MVTNAITLITPDIYSTFDRMAKDIVSSGFTKMTEFQVKYVFLKGYELGVSPLQALDGIYNIQGKPSCSPQFMLALINRSGLLEDIEILVNDTAATVTMKRKDRSVHTEVFSMTDAQKMGLATKDGWIKQPKTMMKWRAVAAAARIVFSDVIQGMYTPEEMGADVNVSEEGEMVVVSKPEPAPVVQIPATVEPQKVEPPVVTSPPANPYAAATGKASKWTDAEKATFYDQALPLYDHAEHGRNSIEKMKREGLFNGKTPAEALDIVRKHVENGKERVGA